MAYDFLGAIHRWVVKQDCDILSGNNNNDDDDDGGYCLLGAYHLPGLTLCASHTQPHLTHTRAPEAEIDLTVPFSG